MTTQQPLNNAAWLVAEKANPLEIRPAPYIPPGKGEVVIKNRAVAVNPCDWMMQDLRVPFPMKYPIVLGQDVAGEVVEVGSEVDRFRVGDRVVSNAAGFPSPTYRSCEGAFQEYSVLQQGMTSLIPSNVSFEEAVVIPLCLSTAACGLYKAGYLELPYPSIAPKPTGEVLLVWGGASSVGCNGIQLGVASGYEVITTASPANFGYVKELGASKAFDYNSKTIVDDLVEALKGKTVTGVLDCISAGGVLEKCAEVLRGCEGRKLIATVRGSAEEMPGVKNKWIIANSIRGGPVAKAVYEDFLLSALTKGTFVPAPVPLIVGKGIEAIQHGFNIQKKGVSAKKVVVSL